MSQDKDHSNLHFVTFFSKEYLIQGITLTESLLSGHKDSVVFILVLDEETEHSVRTFFKGIERVRVLPSDHIQSQISQFEMRGRSRSESIFSVKPMIISEAMLQVDDQDWLIYCDADLYFFSRFLINLKPNSSTLLSEHIFDAKNLHLLKFGRFNAGFVGFRNNETGRRALKWWLNRCKENCSISPTDTSYADQKYLEYFEINNFHPQILKELTINQSLWTLKTTTQLTTGPCIENERIICFHFHGLKTYDKIIYLDLYRYGRDLPAKLVRNKVYEPYLEHLRKVRMRTEASLATGEIDAIHMICNFTAYAYWRRMGTFGRFQHRDKPGRGTTKA